MDAPLLLGFPHFLLFCFVVGLHELGPGGVVARIDGEMMVFPVEVEGEHGEQVPGGQNDHEYLNPVHVLGLFGFFLVLVPRIEEGKDEEQSDDGDRDREGPDPADGHISEASHEIGADDPEGDGSDVGLPLAEFRLGGGHGGEARDGRHVEDGEGGEGSGDVEFAVPGEGRGDDAGEALLADDSGQGLDGRGDVLFRDDALNRGDGEEPAVLDLGAEAHRGE